MIKALRKIRYGMVTLLVTLMDALIPKRKGTFTFAVGSTTVFSGNLKATYDFFNKTSSGEIALLAFSSSGMDLCEKNSLGGVIKTDSLFGLWTLLRSKCIIVEYCHSDWFWPGLIPSRHLFVNLWHGIPIKRIGFAEEKSEYMKKERKYIDLCIASSHVDLAMMSCCFGVPYNRVLLTGYPRNDWLSSRDKDFNSKCLGDLQKQVLAVKGERKLVLYAPTYRGLYSPRNGANTGVYNFKEQELKELRKLLVRHNAVLGIRPHLNKMADSEFPYDDLIVDMSRDVIPDVQVILRNTDVLVSDYSGVWVDYLLMDRPVIGFIHDWEIYNSERGYLYDYKSIFPGALAETSDEFFAALNAALAECEGMDVLAKRQYSKELFHRYDDGEARERLFVELTERVKI